MRRSDLLAAASEVNGGLRLAARRCALEALSGWPWRSSSRSSVAPRSARSTASATSRGARSRRSAQGNDVVVIVSAMSGETNRLLGLAHEVTKVPDAREMDAIAATGEQVSRGADGDGHPGRGRQGALAPRPPGAVLTDDAFTKARIKAIDGAKIFETLDQRARSRSSPGFQGVDDARQHHDARARRLGHERGRRGGGHRRRRVRDLHRRRRRLHDRPERLPVGPQDRPHLVRRDARARVARREGAPDPERGDRDEVRRARPRAKLVQRRSPGRW